MTRNKDRMLDKLFFSILPVQVLIFAMGSVNSIVDGAIAGRCIGHLAVGVVGLYYSMVNVLSAAGSVLLGGTAVLIGRYMGRGDTKKTEGIFSLNLTLTFLIGAIITVISVALPGPLAVLLGANAGLKQPLVRFITGYAIGVIPMLLAQQTAAFLQLERQSRRSYIGIAGMIISNVLLDVLFVAVLDMKIWGLALATSLSNIVYLLILVPYFFSSKSGLHYKAGNILWKDTIPLIKTGLPGALLVFCLALRGIALNRILLAYSGGDGLSAMSAFNMVVGIIIAYSLGNGAVVRMLVSVFAGEEDRSSIKQVIRIVFTKGFALSLIVALAVLLSSGLLAQIFFPDTTSNVYHLTLQIFVIYSLCIPLILICQIFTNYLQAMGHTVFVNVQSVLDGLFFMVVPAMLLAPSLGAFGVWIANPIGILLTILAVPVYSIIYWKRIPKSVDECFFFRPGFGGDASDCFSAVIHSLPEVSSASEKIQRFCAGHDLGKKVSYYSALCLEEMAGNVVEHGFSHDKKTHSVYFRVVCSDDRILLRIRDDCIPFDPGEMASIVSENETSGNIGIRMVYGIADEIIYQNMLGLNVLTITIRDEDLIYEKGSDFLMEKKLHSLDPDLHKRFRETTFAAQNILSRYRLLFPEYTDHSELHSLTVIDSCNRLVGPDQIGRLNADELYVLLMASYLHDVGMGISEKDFEEFKDAMGEKEYFADHPNASKADFVRDRHNEFSGLFIEKYAGLFDIPSPEYVFAIKQVARGHRRTDLFNETEYPEKLRLPNGNTVCLPYLSAVIRIADEIDVLASRNPLVYYDIGLLIDIDHVGDNKKQILEDKKLMAIKSMKMTRSAFILTARSDEEEVIASLEQMTDKLQETLDYCRDVINKRTDFVLTQKEVVLKGNWRDRTL